MSPLLHNSPLVKHVNHICVLDRTESVCNRNGCAALRGQVERGLHHALGGGVEGGGGFVEEQDLGVAQQRAGDCYALALAAGEEGAFCADEGGEAVGKGGYEVINVCCAVLVFTSSISSDLRWRLTVFAGLHDSFLRHIVFISEHVFANRASVERSFLTDDGELRAVVLQVVVF
jgi:hypothetical protein